MKNNIKTLKLNQTEIFYLHDFVSNSWFAFIDTIIDKNNMTLSEKDTYDTLLNLSNKIYELKFEK